MPAPTTTIFDGDGDDEDIFIDIDKELWHKARNTVSVAVLDRKFIFKNMTIADAIQQLLIQHLEGGMSADTGGLPLSSSVSHRLRKRFCCDFASFLYARTERAHQPK